MNKYLGYRCSVCGAEYLPEQVQYNCPIDGGNLDVQLDFKSIKANTSPKDILESKVASIWRYLPLLPLNAVPDGCSPIHTVGWSPVYRFDRLAADLGLNSLKIKDDGRNPTASFKDRASAVVVTRAMEIGAKTVVTASTGNAGAALAGMSAAVGWDAVIFAPKTAPKAKIAQLLIFGAKVILVNGNYDQAFDLAVEASKRYGWYCRNTGYNPFTLEGKKTAAFEIWEQVLQEKRRIPLNIFVSVGDGNIISGIHKGFKDLVELGWLEFMPRIFGVQSERSDAVYQAFVNNWNEIKPVNSTTLADSISVDLPRDGLRAVRAAKETGGQILAVTDEAILDAIAALGKIGIFTEPAAAAAYAGMLKAVDKKLVTGYDDVLVMNTGNGLKDIGAAMRSVPEPVTIDPTLDDLARVLSK
ncbi:MAG TPA: threonine synthase [Bellilinea sp.]|nr:threonine synthase [Bellilinea sp.]